MPKAHSKAGGGGSAQAGAVSDQQASPAGAEPLLSPTSVPFSCLLPPNVCISGLSPSPHATVLLANRGSALSS